MPTKCVARNVVPLNLLRLELTQLSEVARENLMYHVKVECPEIEKGRKGGTTLKHIKRPTMAVIMCQN